MNAIANSGSSARQARENSVGWMLKVLSTAQEAEMNQALKHLDLNIGRFAVLMALSEQEGISQSEIGKKISMPGYATTRTIDALEQNGFVTRCKDDRSRRSHRIYLTEQGQKVLPELAEIRDRLNGRLYSVLSPEEQENLTALLKKLVRSKLG